MEGECEPPIWKNWHSRKENIYADNDTAEQDVKLAKIWGMSSCAEIEASAHIGLKAYLRQKVDEFIEHFRNTDEVIRLEIADYTGARSWGSGKSGQQHAGCCNAERQFRSSRRVYERVDGQPTHQRRPFHGRRKLNAFHAGREISRFFL